METFPTMSILIVDDEETICRIIRNIVSPICPSIDIAANGKDAIKILSEKKIDLLITDILMPVMNGIKLLEIAQKKFPQTICMVITAYGEQEILRKLINLRIYDFIEKPFTNEIIKNRVANALKFRKQKVNLDLAIREFICSFSKVTTKCEFDQMGPAEKEKMLEAGLGILKIKNTLA